MQQAMMHALVWAGTAVGVIWAAMGLTWMVLREPKEEPVRHPVEQPKRPAIIWDELTIEERR